LLDKYNIDFSKYDKIYFYYPKMTATLTIRIDESVKKQLQQRAKEIGLSLNQFINIILRSTLQSNQVVLQFEENEDDVFKILFTITMWIFLN